MRLQGERRQAFLRRLAQPLVMRSSLGRAATAGALALFAAGCSLLGGGDSSKKLVCPKAVIAPNLDSYAQYRPYSGGGPDDVQFSVKITSANAACVISDQGGLSIDTQVTFQAMRRDPQLSRADFTYFVALTDAQQNILAKQPFSLRVEFDPRQTQIRLADVINERLPLRDVANAGNYTVIVGLQVTQQQLDLNRGH